MRITQQSIDEILTAADIVEVVGDFVNLKRKGANYAALSPFTSEKTPSFYVSPSKQIFKCFSTGKGGDSVKFLMEIDSLSYVEALKYLAKKYNIEIRFDKPITENEVNEQSERDALYIVLEYAKEFYKKLLFENQDGKAIGLAYFKERGLNERTINDFGLGFSLDSWDSFLKEAVKQQYSLEVLERAGLIKIGESGKKFDFFRNRIMFPIFNISGKVVALAGRIMTNEKGTAKYINSPETELYHKSKVLYGLFQARQAIRSEDNCLLVEGYMDVLSLYQGGITNVVASSGTSLTEEQIKLINRFTKNVTVLYDGDKAGINAAIRGTDMLLESGLNIKVVVFPEGHDPDSYIHQVGTEEFKVYIKSKAKDFITFKTEILLIDAENDPIKKAQVIREVVNSIAKIKDSIQRSLYFKRCSQLLEIDEQVIISEYNKIQLDKRKKDSGNQDDTSNVQLPDAIDHAAVLLSMKPVNPGEEAEKEIVRILIEYSEFPIDEQTPLYQSLFNYIQFIQFENVIYAKIIRLFQDELMNGNVPGLEYFLNYPDNELEQCLIDILSDKYELSLKWEEKFMVFVPLKDQDKITLLNKVIARLNFEKTKSQFKENQHKLQHIPPNNVQEIDNLLETQQILINYKSHYALELGMVVSG